MEHKELVAELSYIEKLSTQERLKLARRRRMQQLKKWSQIEKDSSLPKSSQKGLTSSDRVKFMSSVMLLEAAARNDVTEVKQLLESSVSPNATNEDGLTALHQCCIDDSAEMLQLLLQFGADVNATDSEKWTPLHAAATCGHLHLARILVQSGANLLAVNADGNMPYDICEDDATLDYIESEMARQGVSQEMIDTTRTTTETEMLEELQLMKRKGQSLLVRDAQNATPLHIASANGYVRVTEFLLQHNFPLELRDVDDWTALHAAACWGHPDVLELLVQHGASLYSRNKNNETPYDICEDLELKERMLQLLSEQEKHKFSDQHRKVKRGHSANTRTQSVRRTSIREKSLSAKREAADEARLRIALSRNSVLSDTSPDSDTGNSSNSLSVPVSSFRDASNSNEERFTAEESKDTLDKSKADAVNCNSVYISCPTPDENKEKLDTNSVSKDSDNEEMVYYDDSVNSGYNTNRDLALSHFPSSGLHVLEALSHTEKHSTDLNGNPPHTNSEISHDFKEDNNNTDAGPSQSYPLSDNNINPTEGAVIPLLGPQPDLIPESVRHLTSKHSHTLPQNSNGEAKREIPVAATRTHSLEVNKNGIVKIKPQAPPRPTPPPRTSSIKDKASSSNATQCVTASNVTLEETSTMRINSAKIGQLINDSVMSSKESTSEGVDSNNGIDIHVTVTVKPVAPGTLAELKQQRALNRNSVGENALHPPEGMVPMQANYSTESEPSHNRPKVSTGFNPQRFRGLPSEYPNPVESRSCCVLL